MRHGHTITLRPVGDADADFTRNLRNRYRHNFFDTHEIIPSQHAEYIARIQKHPWIRFWIIEVAGKPIGTISLNTNKKIAELGNFICPNHSLAVIEAEYLVVTAAFEDYELPHVICNSLEDNPVTQIHSWCGFQTVNRNEIGGRWAILQRTDPEHFRSADIAELIQRVAANR